MTKPIALPALTALLALSACADDPAPTDGDESEASGEVLEGTISDDMLEIDRVRSQAPLAEAEEGEEGSAGPEAEQEQGD